jgi:hypothetical protein
MDSGKVMDSGEKVQILTFYCVYFFIAICLLLFNLCNVEDHESLLSASIANEYMKPIFNAYFYDINLFVIPILSKINVFFPGVQVYGYFLFIETLFIGYLILNYILKNSNLERNRRYFIASAFIILHLANFFLLSTTRIATLGIILFFFLYHQKEVSRVKLVLLFIFTLFLRVDAFAILSVLYIFICFVIYRKITLRITTPFIICLLFLFAYKLFITNQLDEAFNVFYFREIDLTDRLNVAYSTLSKIDKTILDLLYVGIIEEDIYKLSFSDRIMSINVSHLLNSILEPRLYLNTLKNSFENIKSLSFVFIMILSLGVFRLLSVFQVNKRIFFYFLLILFPLVVCTYIILPVRFLYPFLLIIILLILSEFKEKKYYLYLFMMLMSFQFFYLQQLYKTNTFNSNLFLKTILRTENLEKKYGELMVFERYGSQSWRFSNSNINYRYTDNHYLFLNYGFYSTIVNYEEVWKDAGCENPRSIFVKVKFLNDTKLPIIFDSQERVELYEDYLEMRYGYNQSINYVLF